MGVVALGRPVTLGPDLAKVELKPPGVDVADAFPAEGVDRGLDAVERALDVLVGPLLRAAGLLELFEVVGGRPGALLLEPLLGRVDETVTDSLGVLLQVSREPLRGALVGEARADAVLAVLVLVGDCPITALVPRFKAGRTRVRAEE